MRKQALTAKHRVDPLGALYRCLLNSGLSLPSTTLETFIEILDCALITIFFLTKQILLSWRWLGLVQQGKESDHIQSQERDTVRTKSHPCTRRDPMCKLLYQAALSIWTHKDSENPQASTASKTTCLTPMHCPICNFCRTVEPAQKSKI